MGGRRRRLREIDIVPETRFIVDAQQGSMDDVTRVVNALEDAGIETFHDNLLFTVQAVGEPHLNLKSCASTGFTALTRKQMWREYAGRQDLDHVFVWNAEELEEAGKPSRFRVKKDAKGKPVKACLTIHH
ncbi:MAG: hypothetical protein ABH851_02695 [Methanobacteriota archaeon]